MLGGGSTYADDLDEIKDFGDNPGNLKMQIYVPKVLSDSGSLIVALHGCMQSPKAMENLAGWIKYADMTGTVLVYPEQKRGNNISRCFNWFQEENQGPSGEAASVLSMIHWTRTKYHTRAKFTFVTGLSAGGAMAVNLMAVYPEEFAAGFVAGAGPYKSAEKVTEAGKAMRGKTDKNPLEWRILVREARPDFTGKYPRLMIVHGRRDGTVDFNNAKFLAWQWAGLGGRDTVPDRTWKHHPDSDAIEISEWGPPGTVRLVAFKNMLHRYPVWPGDGPDRGGSSGTFSWERDDYYATYEALKFFGLKPLK